MSYDNYATYSAQDASNLQFYSSASTSNLAHQPPSHAPHGPASFYSAAPQNPNAHSNQRNAVGGAIGSSGNAYGEVGGAIAGQGGDGVVHGWLNAFGTGGIEGEMPLLQGRSIPRP